LENKKKASKHLQKIKEMYGEDELKEIIGEILNAS